MAHQDQAHQDQRGDRPDNAARWGENASALFVDLGRVFTPRRDEIANTIVDLIPADPDEAFVGTDVAAGQGWLTGAVLGRFPRARMLVLDGSPAMLAAASGLLAPFPGRFEPREFRLEDPDWTDALPASLRCDVSSPAIHHLAGPAKRALFGRVRERLAPGGALLVADLVEPPSERGRRQMARAWDAEVRRQSVAATGDPRARPLRSKSGGTSTSTPTPPSTSRRRCPGSSPGWPRPATSASTPSGSAPATRSTAATRRAAEGTPRSPTR